MNSFYDFNQRVHLKRDTAQYGLIGVGPFGGKFDASGTCQFVFWEHEAADLVTCEAITDLIAVVKLSEPTQCEVPQVSSDEPCSHPAHWSIAGMPACDEDILYMDRHGSEDTKVFIQPALADIHERRRLFFSVMRRPEIRLLRAALAFLRDDTGVDWRTLASLAIDVPNEFIRTWTLTTDTHVVFCYWPDVPPLDFSAWRLHAPDNPNCDCGFCDWVA